VEDTASAECGWEEIPARKQLGFSSSRDSRAGATAITGFVAPRATTVDIELSDGTSLKLRAQQPTAGQIKHVPVLRGRKFFVGLAPPTVGPVAARAADHAGAVFAHAR
jgi:hypothetical protein